MIPVAYTSFNHYFVNRRVVMMSVAQTLIGIGTMIYPILVQFLMDKYGFRGTMAVLAALNGHVIFGMVAMHPIKWHYKVIKIPVEEEKPCNKFIISYLLIKEKKSSQNLFFFFSFQPFF